MSLPTTTTLNEMCELIVDCPHSTPEWTTTGYIVVRNQNIRDGRLDLSAPSFTHKTDFDQRNRRAKPRGGDIIFTREAPMGEVCMVPVGVECCIGQRQVLLRPRNDVDSKYLLYALRSNYVRHQILWNEGTGSTVSNVRIPVLKALKIPRLGTSEADIGCLLGALDEKINLYRRMNETLAATARVMFKDWFVEFGPTRAKLARTTPYLASDIWLQFPGLLDSDGLPSGWRTEPLLDHARLMSGGTPKTDNSAYWGGEIAWASAKDVSQCPDSFLTSTERTITERGLTESATRMIPGLSTVVVARGATTGRYCMFAREMAMNQTCYALSSKRGRNYWLNCAFGSLVDGIVHAAHGSVFDTITTKTIERANVIIPSDRLLDCFEYAVTPLFKKILANINEAVTLTTTLNILLPKLMSGDVRIRDAEKIAEVVA